MGIGSACKAGARYSKGSSSGTDNKYYYTTLIYLSVYTIRVLCSVNDECSLYARTCLTAVPPLVYLSIFFSLALSCSMVTCFIPSQYLQVLVNFGEAVRIPLAWTSFKSQCTFSFTLIPLIIRDFFTKMSVLVKFILRCAYKTSSIYT